MARRTIRSIFLCGILVLCSAANGVAQQIPPPRPDPVPFVPTLRVRGAERPVRLRTLAVRVDIRGGFAEISLDMLFFNPNARILEGELQFPLLPGQEISGLALDIEGEMRGGVPVPKVRGQEIFDDIVRRGVDPALLEATQGNAYKLRLYPIPANGTRRVMVRFLQPLAGKDGMFTLRLPLAFAKHIDNFSVEALVAADQPPQVESGSLGLVLEQAGLLYRGKAEKADISPEGWLVISTPAPAIPGKGVNAVRWGDKIYFTATALIGTRSEKRVLPETVTLVWDASGSGLNRDHAREYALLDRYFAALGDGTARLVVVRNTAEEPREFSIRQGDWSELKAYIHGLAYDGGTDLAAWKSEAGCREYLLFTDGLANFGNREGDALPPMLPGQRLYAITASIEADHNLLRHASGGRLIDLLRHDGDAAARLLLEDGTIVRLAPGELAGKGEALLDPLATRAEEDANRLLCRLAGWLTAREGATAETVDLRLEHPDGSHETFTVTVPLDKTVPPHTGEDAPLPARLWGRYAITEMEAAAHRHKAAILRLGRELGIVSRETSLIVLETAADYARYDVPPPASLKAEVERLRPRSEGPADAVVYLPMEKLERMWAEKVAWWEKDFSKAARKKKEAPVESEDGYLPEPGGAAQADYYSAPSLAQSASAPPPAPRANATRLSASPLQEMPEAPSAATAASGDGGNAIGIALQTWKSDAPYVARMNRAKNEDMYAIYLDERPSYSRSSAFYLDMADRFFAAKMPELGLRVLSNLAEMEVENRQLLRMLAYRLLEAEEPGLALGILEKVRELAPYEPQSLRDLAAAHIAVGNAQDAAELLLEVARREWDGRFADVNVIALTELNALLATAEKAPAFASLDNRLRKNLASDLRVVLTWDADNTDMDLWVTDPDGEKCYYENRLTAQGGAMSRDCTGGYGPEEFMLRKAKAGMYRVEVDYYGNSQQILAGEVTLYVTLITGFGTSGQKEQAVTMRLKREKTRVLIGEFVVE